MARPQRRCSQGPEQHLKGLTPGRTREHEKSVGAVPGSQAGDGQGMSLRASRTRTGPSDNPVGGREKVDSRGNDCQGFCPRDDGGNVFLLEEAVKEVHTLDKEADGLC